MEYSEWHNRSEKPDLNGVYECRDLSKPDAPHKYSLYRNGWHVECDTIKEAYQSIERYSYSGSPFMNGSLKSLKIGGAMPVQKLQWRGLANPPKGMKFVDSDKWSRR